MDIFSIFFNMTVYCVFSLESPRSYLSKTLKFCCFQFILCSNNRVTLQYTIVLYQTFNQPFWGNPPGV